MIENVPSMPHQKQNEGVKESIGSPGEKKKSAGSGENEERWTGKDGRVGGKGANPPNFPPGGKARRTTSDKNGKLMKKPDIK